MTSFVAIKIWCFVILFGSTVICNESDLSRGLGEKYEWHRLEDGFTLAKTTGKPLMIIIHKTWCEACKAFREKFAKNEATLRLSQRFVMVNLENEEEPKDDKFSPDGSYVPRVLFFDSNGNIYQEIFNKQGNPEYRYFYYDTDSLIESMRKATSMIISTKSDNEL